MQVLIPRDTFKQSKLTKSLFSQKTNVLLTDSKVVIVVVVLVMFYILLGLKDLKYEHALIFAL